MSSIPAISTATGLAPTPGKAIADLRQPTSLADLPPHHAGEPDHVDLSQDAIRMSHPLDPADSALPDSGEPIRTDLVNRIRASLAAGTYDEQDKATVVAHELTRRFRSA